MSDSRSLMWIALAVIVHTLSGPTTCESTTDSICMVVQGIPN